MDWFSSDGQARIVCTELWLHDAGTTVHSWPREKNGAEHTDTGKRLASVS